MHIKSKLRQILGELLMVKSPQPNNYGINVINKQAIKNIIIEPSELPTKLRLQSQGNFIRILAVDDNNSRQIEKQIEKYKDDLKVESIFIADKPLGYFVKPKEEPLYSCSVIVKLNPSKLLESTVLEHDVKKSTLLREQVLDGRPNNEKIVIDFSSPNIAKPFHFGHLKSTILGNYLANLNTYLGNKVTRLNYLGDWGMQYGLLSLGLEEYGKGIQDVEQSSPLRYLLDVYVKANERGQNDEAFYQEAKRRFLSMDIESDQDQLKSWRHIRDLSIEEMKKSYSKLGISFDVFEYESDYAKSSLELANKMMDMNLSNKQEDGLMVAQVTKHNRLINVPILRSDGASLYLTRDIAAAISRKERFNFDRMLYIVGSDQERHFYCISELIRQLGYDWQDKLTHVKMGKVLGMSSRSGQFLLLSDIVEEASKRYEETTRITPTTKVNSDRDIEDVGQQLALSALFMFDMRKSRTLNYEFNWDEVMSVSSRSGINLQTTYARLCSLSNKASAMGMTPFSSIDDLSTNSIRCEEAVNLLSRLDEIDNELHKSYWKMDPQPLVDHAFELCKAVNRARRAEHLRVLGESDERSARTRLTLFERSRLQLKMIIELLGLRPLDKV